MSEVFHERVVAARRGRRGGSPLAEAGNDAGRSAALTLSFTGKGDDPFVNLALSVGAGLALAIDPGQALAVEILAAYAGQSAARTV